MTAGTPTPVEAVPGPVRVTAIGGGHGLARTLTALCDLGLAPTAVVSVADDGGSSGRLRRDFGTIPPGDLRRALSTLVRDPVTRHLLEHRFTGGDVDGHALGNLLLLAAADIHGGDVARGLDVLATMFGTRGTVVPAAARPVDLRAWLADGTEVDGQKAITTTSGVRRVRLVPPDVDAADAAVEAVLAADLVVVGPGSLFTSLLPPLLLPRLARALVDTGATTVLVANLREQPGETTGMDMADHLDVLFAHLPDDLVMDVLVANARLEDPVAPALAAPEHHPRIRRVVTAPLADARGGHDPQALAAVLGPLGAVAAGPGR
ncbi:gluconeogenesis factor YvcK family protein [Salsipaludibacter albus]|uniref:gluconeogenesis factor YvcK family protein n=1 Tax=Salsipaludibacter albus TaxID=2849650 RepID=UPI001EE3F68F|nr:uridine diphosphate-N-acetylglucosamine-binding protein YvcK [Salsipaludibacter albus]